MKKIGFMVVILMVAAPALATVNITAADLDAEGPLGVVGIDYEVTEEPNRARAFALEISVTDGNIVAINDFHVGESTVGSSGYGIFPGNIVITGNTVDDYGNPVAPNTAPDTPGQLGGSSIIIEMGSLFVGDGNAPGNSGRLCTVTCDTDCLLSIVANALRGKVVLEGAQEVDPNVTGATDVPVVLGVPCFPSNHPDYQKWLDMGELHGWSWGAGEGPPCWCYARQCHGDADGIKTGSIFSGYTYVGPTDLAIFGDAWDVKEPANPPTPSGPGIHTVPNGICCDFAHDLTGSIFSGYTYVGPTDLAVFGTYWDVKEPANPPTPSGPGIPGDCGGTLEP